MATQVPPKKNAAYTGYVSLVSQANTNLFQVNPTLAAGDVKVSTDGGAFANLATLPVVTPSAGRAVKVDLSSGEMNGDNIVVQFVDAAGAEWCDLLLNLQTSARQIDDLAFPATSGRSMVVDAAGLVDANAVKVGPTGSGTAQTARDIGASVLLSSGTGTGQLDITSGVAKANLAQILGTALTETAGLLAGGFKKFFNIASPAATMDHGILVDTVTTATSVTNDVGITQAGADKAWGTTSRTLTAFSFSVAISGAAVQAIWDALTSALTTSGSIGKRLVDFITGDAFVRLGAPAGASVSADVAAVKAQTASIQTDTDDIQTRLPAALVGGRIDSSTGAMAAGVVTAAAIATDAIDADALAADAVAEIADGVWDEATAGHTTAGTTGKALIDAGGAGTPPTVAQIADAVWDEAIAGHLGAGSTGEALDSASTGGDPWATSLPGAYGAGTAGKIVGDNLNATVSSRAPEAGGNVAAIKTKTDQLVFTIANKVDSSIQAAGDFAQAAADKVWASATRTLTAFAFAVDVSAAGVQAVWDALTSALTTVGSVGKRIADNLDAAISTRLATAGYTAPPTVGAIADQVWDEATSGHTTPGTTGKALTDAGGAGTPPTVAQIADGVWDELIAGHLGAGSTGEALDSASSGGDPWGTALPGAYGAGTAGKIVGDRLDVILSTRASQTSADDLPTNAELATALAAADDAVLAAIAALNNLSPASVRAALGLASANLDTQLDALPTNAELATALAAADDAVLAAIAALTVGMPNVDGLTYDEYMTAILAVLFGVAVPAGSTVAFKKRNGTTTKVTVTYGTQDGERTASVIS